MIEDDKYQTRMDQFQCVESGMVSKDVDKVKKHMLAAHKIKVETDVLIRKYFCTICIFTTRDRNDFKTHLMTIHQKEKYNWMVEEIESEFSCDECDLVFPRKSGLESHHDTVHNGDRKEIQHNIEGEMIDEEQKVNKTKIECHICGICCISMKNLNDHMTELHPTVTRDIIIIKDDSEDKVVNIIKENKWENDDEPEYTIETQPKNAVEDKKQNIKFTGDSEDFNEGLKKLKDIVTKGSKYNFNGCEIRIKDEVKVGRPTTIEVTTDILSGTAGLRFYFLKKSKASVAVCKQAGQGFAVVEALPSNFIKPLLDAHQNKVLNNDFINRLKLQSNNKTMEKR